MTLITDLDRLRAIYGPPNERALRKILPKLDRHARRFIELSPFLFLSTTDANGLGDVAPRGDRPGFVAIEDDATLLIPDLGGNNRLDSLANMLSHSGIGLIFLVPGLEMALRVNGIASLDDDAALLDRVSASGNIARCVIRVATREVFFHNARPFRLSRLWEPDSWPGADAMAPVQTILAEQTGLD
jgi:uncharacterized protein